MSMDMSAFFWRANWSFRQECWVSIAFGMTMLLASFALDQRCHEDYAFWGYLFGLLAFWGGLSFLGSGNPWDKLLHAAINAILILIAVGLNRKAFLVFGSLGIFGYLADLAHTLFRDSLLFPFVLSLLGIAVIGLGVLVQRRMPKRQDALPIVSPRRIRK
jgi:hypothetical protein